MKPFYHLPIFILAMVLASACNSEVGPASFRIAGTPDAPTAVELGKEIRVSVIVQNTGDTVGAGRLRLLENAELSAIDVTVPAGAKKSYSLRVLPTKEGEHVYQLVLMQGRRQVETRDFTVSVFTEPDLYWVGASVTEGKILSGSGLHVQAKVANRGSKAAGARCLVSIDGVSVGSFPIATVPAAGTSVVSQELPVTGFHHGVVSLELELKGDAGKADNRFVGGILQVVEPNWSLSLPYAVSVTKGDAFILLAQIVNETDFALPGTGFSLYFSADNQFDVLADALIAASVPVPPLGARETAVVEIPIDALTVGLPWSEVGTYTAFGWLDADGAASDDLGGNQITITSPLPTMDFKMRSVSVSPNEVKPGDGIALFARVDNLGNTAAPAVVSFTLGSQLVWQSPPVTVAAGGTYDFVTSVTVPALADGTYGFSATADSANVVSEILENNNGLAATAPVDVVMNPDLVGTLVENNPATTATVDPVALTIQWRNRGFTASQAVTATVWMPRTSLVNMADFITTVTIPALAARASTDAVYTLVPYREGGIYAWRFDIAPQPGEVFWANNVSRSGYVQTVDSAISTLWDSPFIFTSLSSPTWFDVNGDGTQDVLLGGESYIESFIVAIDGNNGQQLWSYLVGNSNDDAIQASPALADVDTTTGTANPVLFIGGRTGNLIALDAATGSPRWTVSIGPWVETPALADIDGDGKLDVIVTAAGNDIFDTSGILAVYRGYDGLLLRRFEDAAHEYYASPAVGDLTGDGKSDIVVGSGGETDAKPGYVAVFDGAVTSMTYAGPLWSYPTTKGVEASPVLVDVDADGVDDVIAAGLDGFVAAFKGMGDGAGNPLVLWRTNYPGYEFLASPAVGDVAGDGLPEIVVSAGRGVFETPEKGTYDSNRIAVLKLDGTEIWHYDYGTAGGGGSSPILADIDGDGKSEILFTTAHYQNNNTFVYFSKLFVLRGDGVVLDIREFDGLGYGTPFIHNMGSVFWDVVLSGYSSEAMSDYRFALPAPDPVTISAAPWPKFRGNRRNTGRYLDAE